jgi:hypothetical protein
MIILFTILLLRPSRTLLSRMVKRRLPLAVILFWRGENATRVNHFWRESSSFLNSYPLSNATEKATWPDFERDRRPTLSRPDHAELTASAYVTPISMDAMAPPCRNYGATSIDAKSLAQVLSIRNPSELPTIRLRGL